MTRAFALATFAALSLAAASAQAQRGGGTAILYELPNFQGRSVIITESTPDLGRWRFNDRAQSARFEGRWRVCEHDQFKGRCQEISGPVIDLTTYGLFGQISSLEPAYRPGGGFPPPDRDPRGIDGSRTVFFPRPTIGGTDVAAGDRAADGFCRRQGLGQAVWFDSSERAGRAVTPDGQFVGRSPVIRDLLCRKY